MKRLIILFISLHVVTIINTTTIHEVDIVTSYAKLYGNYWCGSPLVSHQLEREEKYEEELYWLSRIISAEARGESITGQIAVGNVVMNRVKSNMFPDTIKEVIFQKGQFCPVENKSIINEPTEEAVKSAKMVLDGTRVISEDVLFFYNSQSVSKTNWIRGREIEVNIGNHSFAK